MSVQVREELFRLGEKTKNNVMVWPCMAASGTGPLVFITDVTADRSHRMNSEVYRTHSLLRVSQMLQN